MWFYYPKVEIQVDKKYKFLTLIIFEWDAHISGNTIKVRVQPTCHEGVEW